MNIKQKQILKNMVENGCSLGEAMRKAGYSYAYSRNPQKIQKTKVWKDLIKDYFDDQELLQKTKELLYANKAIRTTTGIVTSKFPDYKIRLKAIDMIYKLKGYYPSKKVALIKENPYKGLSLEELDSEITRLEELLGKSKR